MSQRIRTLLELGAARLAPRGDSPRLDAQVLMAHVVDQTRTWVLAHASDEVSDEQAGSFELPPETT